MLRTKEFQALSCLWSIPPGIAIILFTVKNEQNLAPSCHMKSLHEYGQLAALQGEQQTLALRTLLSDTQAK